jgi:hypothetical protein
VTRKTVLEPTAPPTQIVPLKLPSLPRVSPPQDASTGTVAHQKQDKVLPDFEKQVIPSAVKPILQPAPIEPEKLKPALHDKIDRLDNFHLSFLNRVLLQLEAEGLAGRLGEGFDKDDEQGLLRRIPELVKAFRHERPYA